MSAAIQTNIFLRGNFIEFNLDTHILLPCQTSVSYLRAATPKYKPLRPCVHFYH